ncbi:MAG: metallophosphoesterase [Hyphomicrobiaceae bacterium]|nr:metallophosphoesterase [Hyphomicrobiaceae bacterium]
MFTLAYLSDPHIAPLPAPLMRHLLSKRIFGYINWRASRKNIHDRRILDAITQDMAAQGADHIAVGGDLVNLALPDEFTGAHEWLRTLGTPEQVSVIPGNHDAYVPLDHDTGFGQWMAYMTTNVSDVQPPPSGTGDFPYIRQFERVALVGLSSAVPKPPFIASGKLGAEQIATLNGILQDLGQRDMFRIVMVHHPPLQGLSGKRRGLDDVQELEEVLQAAGAELVLYGHRHVHALDTLACDPPAPVVGAASASSSHDSIDKQARYYLFRIWRKGKAWKCEMTVRGLTSAGGSVTALEKQMLMG